MKKIFSVITLLLITPLLTESLENLMQDAAKYNINREFEKAYQCSIKALEISPNDPFAFFFIGDYHGSNGDFNIAIEYYDKAIENHEDSIFEVAHYQRAATNMILNKDLSYCADIKILEEYFKENDDAKFLKDEHPEIFGLCTFTESRPDELIYFANLLANKGYCGYSQLIYNEASKEGTRYDLELYDKSVCSE